MMFIPKQRFVIFTLNNNNDILQQNDKIEEINEMEYLMKKLKLKENNYNFWDLTKKNKKINQVNQLNNGDCNKIEEKKHNDSYWKVIDVSNIWDRFTDEEIIYFDDENDENNENDENKNNNNNNIFDEITILNGLFMGLGRIYCGTINENSNIHIFGPRHHDGENDHIIIKGYKLFHFMGKDIGHMKCIPSGNICGIGGIHEYLQKSGFITTSINVPMVKTISTMSFPIVRVAIEPKKYKDFENLKLGLKLLNKCDTGAEILLQENGEYVICASGELHLARCVRDLKDTFAKNIELNVSEPIVSFKETIINVTKQELNDRKQYIEKLNKEIKKNKDNDNNDNNNINDIRLMTIEEYEIYINNYIKKSKFPDIN